MNMAFVALTGAVSGSVVFGEMCRSRRVDYMSLTGGDSGGW